MKSILPILTGVMLATTAFAAAPSMTPATGRGRASMSNQMMAAPRAVASKGQISNMAYQNETVAVKNNEIPNDDKMAVTPDEMKPADKDLREREKRACLQNNIGIGNTFVWASRFSNIDGYSTMIEDVENPENNTCFVWVQLKSDDAKVDVSDVPGKYYEMDQIISCGEWTNYDTVKQRILDAKKSARAWATVGGAVGGAAVGVGAMELFGNRLIGGAVEGQQGMGKLDLLKSQLAVFKAENEAGYNTFMDNLKQLQAACEDFGNDSNMLTPCTEYKDAFDLVTEPD